MGRGWSWRRCHFWGLRFLSFCFLAGEKIRNTGLVGIFLLWVSVSGFLPFKQRVGGGSFSSLWSYFDPWCVQGNCFSIVKDMEIEVREIVVEVVCQWGSVDISGLKNLLGIVLLIKPHRPIFR